MLDEQVLAVDKDLGMSSGVSVWARRWRGDASDMAARKEEQVG